VSRPFTSRRNRIRVHLSAREADLLRQLPILLDSVGQEADDPAAVRLSPAVYPGDAAADSEWHRFAGPELDRGRSADRAAFTNTLGQPDLSPEEAEGWLRMIGEARLVLGARLGITEDGWSGNEPGSDPVEAFLHYLSWLQEGLVVALSGGLPAPP
jgi:hypothetical protein